MPPAAEAGDQRHDGRGREDPHDVGSQGEGVVAEQPGQERHRWRGQDEQGGEADRRQHPRSTAGQSPRRQPVGHDLEDDVDDAHRADGAVPEAGDLVGVGQPGGLRRAGSAGHRRR